MVTRRDTFRFIGGLTLASMNVAPSKAESIPIVYGWLANNVDTVDGEVHVSTLGDDRNPGTLELPLRTIREAVNRLSELSEGTVLIHAGVYRETIDLRSLEGSSEGTMRQSYRFARYGSERATITAADQVNGWKSVQDDSHARGLVDDACWYFDLPLSELEHNDPFALNLHVDGVFYPIGVLADKEAPKDVGFDQRNFLAGSFKVDAGSTFVSSVSSDHFVGLDPSQIENSQLLVYAAPNIVVAVKPADFDPLSGTVFLPPEDKIRIQKSDGEEKIRFALQNYPTQLREGTWIFRRVGDAIRIFIRTEAAKPPINVEISKRRHCVLLGNSGNIELRGLEFVRAAGSGRLGGACVLRDPELGVLPEVNGISIVGCRIGENYCASGNGYGALYLANGSNISVQDCSINFSRGTFGLFLMNCSNAIIRGLEATFISKSPARFYGLRNSVLCFSRFEDCGWDAHSNKFNFYEGSDTILVYGVRTKRTGGYATYQEASRIFFAFCDLDCDPESQNRALVSQNRSLKAPNDASGEPFPGGTFWYWNMSLTASQKTRDRPNSLVLGPGASTQKHSFHNCRIHGGGFADIYINGADKALESRSHNIYTALSFWQSNRYGWWLGDTERADRRPELLVGLNMLPIIFNDIAPLFPNFNEWHLDIDGKPVDWTNAPIGAYA